MRTNTNLLDLVARAGALVVLVLTALAVVTVALPGATPTAPASPVPVASTAQDTAQQDAAAEGTDVLPVAFHDAPAELWNGLIDQYPGAYEDDVPGIGTFYVPVDSVIDVPGGVYVATSDGFRVCLDGVIGEECDDTSPALMLDIPTRTATEVYDYMTYGTSAVCGGDAQCDAYDADQQLAALGTMTDGAVQSDAQVVSVAYSEAMPTGYPRRSPHGGRVLPRSQWLDNSPVYRDGYVWLVDDTKHTTSWRTLAKNGSLASPDRYNPPNRVCLRDIVCIEIGIPTEDGHRVLPSFYSRVTTTGATQARCDYLGKRRVPDATYGHRCV